MNQIEIINEIESISEVDELDKLINFALEKMNVKNAIMNVIIVDKETIQKINKEYRNKDAVTDVISFALEDDKTFINLDYRVLGDIYICLDRAREQAKEYRHSLKREISFLTVHGILHLLGYDHMNKEDEKVMFQLQEEILNEFGIKKEN